LRSVGASAWFIRTTPPGNGARELEPRSDDAGRGNAQFADDVDHGVVGTQEVLNGLPLRRGRDRAGERDDAGVVFDAHVRRGRAEGADERTQRVGDGAIVGDGCVG
jgi:hypothetical protein